MLSKSNLGDGIAGLRLVHSGCPSDVVVELINIEENGRVARYNAVRNVAFHLAATQIAVSFNLESGNQSFLFLKTSQIRSSNHGLCATTTTGGSITT